MTLFEKHFGNILPSETEEVEIFPEAAKQLRARIERELPGCKFAKEDAEEICAEFMQEVELDIDRIKL